MALEMDVDGGASRDRAELGRDLLELTLAVASGQRTKGEAAGHHQLQIWRNWLHGDPARAPAHRGAQGVAGGADGRGGGVPARPARAGRPLRPKPPPSSLREAAGHFDGWVEPTAEMGAELGAESIAEETVVTERIALILPTSLCSSEPARHLAASLQATTTTKHTPTKRKKRRRHSTTTTARMSSARRQGCASSHCRTPRAAASPRLPSPRGCYSATSARR